MYDTFEWMIQNDERKYFVKVVEILEIWLK